MNDKRILSSSIKDELNAWNRAESPLVSFARSLRMEGPTDESDDPKKGSDDDSKPSLLKGIDLDNLPEDVRESLMEREKEYISNYTERQKVEAERAQAIELAGKHQSRADRFHGFLKAHNLDPDNDKPPTKKESELYESELTASLLEDGLKPDVAKAYAKMLAKTAPIISRHVAKDLSTGLAPMVSIIGDLRADQALQEARSEKNDPDGILDIPEVLTKVTENLKYLAQAGSPIDLATIESVKFMAYGQHISKNPESRPGKQQTALATRLRGMGGGHVNSPRSRGSGDAPQPANQDTANAVQATTALMLKGLNIKSKP